MASEQKYVREKLRAATRALTESESAAPLRERLRLAFLAGLMTLQPDDFVDDESRASFTAIKELITTQRAVHGEGTVQATLTELSDDQATSIAKLIVDLDSY